MALIGSAAPCSAAATAAAKCEAGKNGTVGKYAACLHKAHQKYVAGAGNDPAKRDAALLSCAAKYAAKWQKLEDKAGTGVCPSESDETDVRAFFDACVSAVVDSLGGAALPLDVVTCNDELADCELHLPLCEAANPGLVETGQTLCHNNSGSVVACAGTGRDGDLQRGNPRSFTDNGDGTITDDATGLMWEKMSNDGSIHDKDTTFTWANAFTKISTLNDDRYAGHSDWRLPSQPELESLRNIGETNPTAFPAFETACPSACTPLTCSCTFAGSHWSSTTYESDASKAWGVSFLDGLTGGLEKSSGRRVRAVRSAF